MHLCDNINLHLCKTFSQHSLLQKVEVKVDFFSSCFTNDLIKFTFVETRNAVAIDIDWLKKLLSFPRDKNSVFLYVWFCILLHFVHILLDCYWQESFHLHYYELAMYNSHVHNPLTKSVHRLSLTNGIHYSVYPTLLYIISCYNLRRWVTLID